MPVSLLNCSLEPALILQKANKLKDFQTEIRTKSCEPVLQEEQQE